MDLATFWQRMGQDIIHATIEHIYLTFIALILALFIAIPLGIYLTRTRYQKLADIVLNIFGVVQTIPSLALIALIVVIFALAGLPTIGTLPGIVALVMYALLPLLRNTYTGIKQVDPALIEVARGMGMRDYQMLFTVELPLALPVITAGIRISTVWTIGVATLVGLIGAGGLGDLIIRGLRTIQIDYLLAGTVPAAILALLADFIISRLERWLVPEGLSKNSQ